MAIHLCETPWDKRESSHMAEPYVDIIRINQIVVIESLGPHDRKLARDMALDVNFEIAEQPIKASFELCDGVKSFQRHIAELVARTTANRALPLLHIECHGDEDEGLVFTDSSTLPWVDLWDLLRPLNIAMKNRLVVVLATCVSFSSITSVSLTCPAPCFFLIAPTKRVWPDELYSAFKEFYSLLSLGDAEKAMTTLVNRQYQEGKMLPVSAGEWFSALMTSFLNDYADKKGLRAAALDLATRAKADGLTHFDLRYWKRHIKSTLPNRLNGYFNTFFMLDKFPRDRPRFSREQEQLDRMIAKLGYPPSKR